MLLAKENLEEIVQKYTCRRDLQIPELGLRSTR